MTAPIVVGTDLTDASRQAFRSAVALAKDLRAPLVVVHAFGRIAVPATAPDATVEQMRSLEAMDEAARAHELTSLWAEAARREGVPVHVVAQDDNPALLILRTAAEHGAGMVVVGAHGRGRLARLLLGSVSQDVVRGSGLPVLIVPDRDRQAG